MLNMVILRADAAFYTRAVVTAAHNAGASFSVTAPLYPSVTRAIAAIADDAWTPIRYPEAIFDEAEQRWISDAEVAEIPFAAFRAHRHRLDDQVTGRLIVRRVRRLNPRQRRRAGRAVPWLSTPRHLHRLCAADAASRGAASPTRRHRAGLRRLEGWPARAPAVGSLRRQQRLAGVGRHSVQPDPGCRCTRLASARQSHHRRYPTPTDHGSRAACPLRPPTGAASARPLALAASLATAVRPSLRTTHPRLPLTTKP